MGVGRITDAREVTQGTVHAAHDGAGESAHRIAAIGAHAGREAQRTIAAGLGDAAKNIGDTLKVVGDFAVKALWEKPIAEAEEKLRELDLKCRTEGWSDENGDHPGFDLVRGAEAANIGEQWDAYMARKAKEFTKNLTAGQREELSRRTAKFRAETRARLTERGAVEAITSNLADIDIIATRDGERNVMQAVANANEALEKERAAVEIGGPERYGKRNDGTAKGRGYFGEIQLPNGGVATEYSVGVEIDGKETEIPTLVPTLTKDELKTMVEDVIPNGKKVPDEIVKKAAEHAKARMKSGLSPFASNLEAEDNAAAVSISDQLVTKRNELIRRKIEGGLGFKSEALATAEADRIVRAEALETVKALAAAGHYDRARKLVEQGGKLGYDDAALAKGRELVDGMEVTAAVNEANVAISTIRDADGNYPAGRVETIERSIATLKRVGAAQKKDSKLAASAAEAAAQMDRHAELIRFGEMVDNPSAVGLGAANLFAAKNPFHAKTRDARCWERAREAMMKPTLPSHVRKAFIDNMKTNGRKYAQANPAQFYEDANNAVMSGVITKGDKDMLVDDFESKFRKGFPGAGDEAPVLQQKFAAIASVFKGEFGNDIEAEVARDKYGFVTFDQTGAFAYDKKATPTGLTVEEKVDVPSEWKTDVYGETAYIPAHTLTVRHMLTPEEKLELSNKALKLVRLDGMELGFDPVTGIEMENGKTYKVNLVADLKRMCKMVKSRKESERVRDQVFADLRGKRAMDGIVGRVTDPFGLYTTPFDGQVEDYAAGVEADKTEAERRAPAGSPKDVFETYMKTVRERGKKLRD